jgi:indole-3-glycerol phosphate synthase
MILDEIVASKKLELAETRKRVPLTELEKQLRKQPVTRNFAEALKGESIKLIAEVKKASPSKGLIASDFNPVNIARTYSVHGASAISILTESKYFLGNLDIFDDIGLSLGEKRIPLLRKDFLLDPYQIFESRAHGADALLLIVTILQPGELKELYDLTHNLGMEALVEVHNEQEIEIALNCGVSVIGINNRDLKTFKVDLSTTERLVPKIPRDKTIVSESGIKTRADIDRLKKCGVNAVLIGEALMSSSDILARMQEFL